MAGAFFGCNFQALFEVLATGFHSKLLVVDKCSGLLVVPWVCNRDTSNLGSKKTEHLEPVLTCIPVWKFFAWLWLNIIHWHVGFLSTSYIQHVRQLLSRMHIQVRKSNVYPFIGYLHSQVIFPVETGRKSDESLRGSGQWWIWAAPTMTSRRVCCATQQWKTGSSKCSVWKNRGFPQLQDITRRYQEVFSGVAELILNFPIGLSSMVIFSFLPPSRASPRIWSTFGQLYSENGLRENPHETSNIRA